MRHDPRVWVPYRRAEDSEAASAFAATMDDTRWEALLGPLVDAMVAKLPAAEVDTRGMDARIAEALARFARLDAERASGNQETLADELIGERFGRLAARRLSAESPASWLEFGLALLDRYSAYLAFIQNLPRRPDTAEAVVAAVGSGDLLEIVHTFGELRDLDEGERSAAKAMQPAKDSCPARAQFVHAVDRLTGSASLSGKYLVASDLLAHLDPVRWMTWLQGHGFVVLAVAFGFLGRLDEALAILERVWDSDVVDDLAVTFLLRDGVNLMLRLDEAMRRASVSEADRVTWASERSDCISRMARLVGGGARPRVAADVFWGGWSDRRDAPSLLDELRTQTSDVLAKSGAPLREVTSRLLGVEPHSRALQAVATLFWSGDEEIRRELRPSILAAYERWLAVHSYWSQPLKGDELDMTWRIAGVVAALEDPTSWWITAFTQIDVRPEGWKLDFRKHLESLRATAHLLTVGGMAAEWLFASRHEDSVRLFNETWTRLQAWLREGADEHGDASTPVQQIWARLAMILGERATELVRDSIGKFDEFPLLVYAVRAYADNLGPAGARMAPPIIDAFRARRRELESLWRREAAREHDSPQRVVNTADALLGETAG